MKIVYENGYQPTEYLADFSELVVGAVYYKPRGTKPIVITSLGTNNLVRYKYFNGTYRSGKYNALILAKIESKWITNQFFTIVELENEVG